MKKVKISEVKSNPNNPRVIKDDKFRKLVQSLKDLPEMAEVRPIVVNQDMIVLGGNMRLKAMKEAGWKEVPIEIVDWSEEKQQEFIIKDNVGFGEWDWDILNSEWNINQINDWGIDIKAENYFEIEEKDIIGSNSISPSGSDDNYSTFELIMLHENKLLLLDTLSQVKQNYLFEKQEDALMEIIRKYNQI
jgi:hypothetical protein